MNADHAEAVSLYATRLLGMPEGEWRMTGVDPDGIDLRAGALRARLDFAERGDEPGGAPRMSSPTCRSRRGLLPDRHERADVAGRVGQPHEGEARHADAAPH